MNIDRLKYFSVIVETKNLRKASELIGITPGSLSKAISVLESELSIKLLRPEGRGIEITEEGLEIYKKSLSLLNEFQKFNKSVKEPSRKKKYHQLKIGTFEVFSSHFISAFLEAELPEHEAIVLELLPGKIEAAILEGIIDFGLTYLPVPHQKLNFIEIGQLNMSIWGLKGKWHNIPFDNWPFAVPTSVLHLNTTEYHSLDMWPDKQKSRLTKYGFEMLETALQTTRHGLSVLHCPDFIPMIHNQYVTSKYQLERLPYPSSIKKVKPVKAYLVVKKESIVEKSLEGKLAKFFRSFK